MAGKALCMLHHGEAGNRGGLRHGLVTGEVPRGTLLEFLNSARGREENEAVAATDVERVKQGRKPRQPKAQNLWYARYRF